jgi:hypothetical protein
MELQLRKRLIFTITTTLALLLTSVTSAQTATIANSNVESSPIVEAASNIVLTATATPAVKSVSNLESYVRSYFKDTPILAEISRCESRFTQFTKTGEVMRGIVREDVGLMQINEFYHKDTAEKLGYNLYTIDGNLSFGKYLYEKYGTSPWSASAYCWNK